MDKTEVEKIVEGIKGKENWNELEKDIQYLINSASAVLFVKETCKIPVGQTPKDPNGENCTGFGDTLNARSGTRSTEVLDEVQNEVLVGTLIVSTNTVLRFCSNK